MTLHEYLKKNAHFSGAPYLIRTSIDWGREYHKSPQEVADACIDLKLCGEDKRERILMAWRDVSERYNDIAPRSN